jgi:hypothetical protein
MPPAVCGLGGHSRAAEHEHADAFHESMDEAHRRLIGAAPSAAEVVAALLAEQGGAKHRQALGQLAGG